MSCNVTAVNRVLGYSVLVDTDGGKIGESLGVDFCSTVGYNTDDDFLPAILAPYARTIASAEMGNVFYDTMECTSKENFMFLFNNRDELMSKLN